MAFLTRKIAGIVDGSVQAVAEDTELRDVERSKVKLGYIAEVGAFLELFADAAVIKASWVFWLRGCEWQRREPEEGKEMRKYKQAHGSMHCRFWLYGQVPAEQVSIAFLLQSKTTNGRAEGDRGILYSRCPPTSRPLTQPAVVDRSHPATRVWRPDHLEIPAVVPAQTPELETMHKCVLECKVGAHKSNPARERF